MKPEWSRTTNMTSKARKLLGVLRRRAGVSWPRRAGAVAGSARGLGHLVPGLLVSAIRLRPAATGQGRGRSGLDAGIFRPALGKGLSPGGRSEARQVPVIPLDRVQALPR